MRKDYEYVSGATALILTTTECGDQYLEALNIAEMESPPDTFIEMMLLCQTEYVILPNPCTIVEMFQAVCEAAKEYDIDYEVGRLTWEPTITRKDVDRALDESYLAVKLVIWD